ncbi:hypothetical protein EMUR_01835 [Ehrlichia muris AS145]|uniref:Uncharacterized protein n=2 Tax=Ehrlichia muris TaxID=35795 RepID=V9RA03_9RICK|nr:hypothetical protein EMUR_01835 [Ehrlichia muris AS145]
MLSAVILAILLSKIHITYTIPCFMILGIAAILVSGIMSFVITRAILACQDATESHNTLPSIKENEQMALFIPLSDDQFNKLDSKGKIVKIKYDRVGTGINLNGEKDIVLNVTQRKYGLCATRVVDVVVSADNKCMLLMKNQDIAQLSGRGIVIVVNKRPSEINDIVSKRGFYIKYPEMKDGVLSLACNYSAVDNTRGHMSNMLRYNGGSTGGISVYELLLKDLLRSCPGDSSLVVPSSTSLRIGEENLWINQNDGQLTVALLANFSSFTVLGRTSIFGENEKLCNKIALLRDYIEQNNVAPDTGILTELFEKIRYKYCEVHDRHQYSGLYKDYDTKYGMTFSDLIRSKIRNGDRRLAAMVAIASHQCQGVTDSDTKTNDFLKGILCSVGSGNLIAEVHDLIDDDLCKRVNLNSYKLIGLGISCALQVMSKSLGGYCSAEALISYARSYIMSECYSSVTVLRNVPCSLKFYSIQDIKMFNVRENRQVSIDNSNVECVSHSMSM